MLKRLPLVLGVLAVLLICVPSAAAAELDPGPDIVVLKDDANPDQIAKQHGKQYGLTVEYIYRYALRGYAARLSAGQISALGRDRSVLFVDEATIGDPPQELPPSALRAGAPDQPAQVLGFSLDRVDADLSSTVSGDGGGSVQVNVAVLDTGMQSDHPDLNVVGGTNCLDFGRKGDFADLEGHGTLVGGLIGALDNGIGRVGVTPGARLFGVRVLDQEGFGTDAEVTCGIDWVTGTRFDGNPNNDIAVSNMSLGGVNDDSDDGRCGRSVADSTHHAICGSARAGITTVASAGNEDVDVKQMSPATYSEVLTATAMGDRDGVPGGLGGQFVCPSGDDQFDDFAATFSNFATLPADQAHTLAAPGVCLASTYIGSQYAVSSGTSFSSPIAAGTVALCIASGPCSGRRPEGIIRKIVADAAAYNQANPDYGYEGDPLRPVPGKYYGYLIRAGLY